MELNRGVLVGCDKSQEWLLSWWWENYRKENKLPVAFADFGMSQEGRTWCQNRGILLDIDVRGLRVALKEEIEASIVEKWERSPTPFWASRSAWFKKPFAILNTPFFQTVWLDLDCEVLGAIESIFGCLSADVKMGLVRTTDRTEFNSGVIVFERTTPILKQWTEVALFQNHRFLGDQDALSQIIAEKGYLVHELHPMYNWVMCRGLPMHAVILHWASDWGKEYIRKEGGLKGYYYESNAIYQSLKA